jgi:hypothetical protein
VHWWLTTLSTKEMIHSFLVLFVQILQMECWHLIISHCSHLL